MRYATYDGKVNVYCDNNENYKFFSDVYDKWGRRGSSGIFYSFSKISDTQFKIIFSVKLSPSRFN